MLVSSTMVGVHLGATNLPSERARIAGRIAEVPDRTPYGTVAIVELDPPFDGRVRLTLTGTPTFTIGTRLAVDAVFAPPDGDDVPAFRSKSIAVRRGAHLSGSARALDVEVLREPARMRSLVASYIDEPTVAAMALSERGRADPAREEALVLGGHSFVFSLGGASMMLLLLGATALAGRVRSSRWARVPVALLGLGLYALQDQAPSAFRVVITFFFAYGWCLVFRKPQLRQGLPAAIVALLLFDPAAVGDVYYQLAVATLTAMLTLYPALSAHAPKPARPAVLLATIALATAPLLLRQFDRITLLSLASNMLVLPIATVVVIPLSWFGLTSVASVGLSAIEALAVGPASAIATPTMLEVALFYAAMFSFAAKPATRRTRGFAAISLAALLIAIAASLFIRETDHQTKLPGGFSVETSREKGILVQSIGEPSADPERGTRILDLYLKKHRVTAIDELRLPHQDSAVEAAIHRQREVRHTSYGDH